MPAPIIAFQDYPVINAAYASVRSKIESYLEEWNTNNPDRVLAALDLWIMGYFHFCIPSAENPPPLGADHKEVRIRLRKILCPLFEESATNLTPSKYAKTLENNENLTTYLKRLVASKTDNPIVTPYIIPGTSIAFKHLYHAGYVKTGDKIVLRARSKDYECTVNELGKVELNVSGKVQKFVSVTQAGIEGLEYPGFNQWKSSRLITAKGESILLDALRQQFDRDQPFPAHFDSPKSKNVSVISPQNPVAITEEDNDFYEGSINRISIEVRERDAAARRACIAHYGANCFICQFDFGKFYGPEAKGFIHVHHRDMLANRKGATLTDAVKDLVPLCPNCHSVVHLRKDAYEVKEVKRMIAKQRSANR